MYYGVVIQENLQEKWSLATWMNMDQSYKVNIELKKKTQKITETQNKTQKITENRKITELHSFQVRTGKLNYTV